MCCPKSVSSPFADCSAQELGWCRWGDGASGLSGPAGLGGHCWGICAKGLRTPNHASPQRRIHWVWVSGSRDPQQREGPWSRRQPIPAFSDVQRRVRCENGLRYFPKQRRAGAGVCSPRSSSCPFAECRAQEQCWCRWGAGPSVLRCPVGLGGHCRGLGAECLRTPNPASTRRRTRLKWVSGSGDPQQSSRAQGARGSPAPLCPTSSGGLGA